MSTFESLALVTYPRETVFEAARDALDVAVQYVDDIERVVVQHRTKRFDGSVEVINTWYGKTPIPPQIRGVLQPHMLVWTDHAVWTPVDHTCRWQVRSQYFPDHVRCRGTTRYEETTGAQATRVVLDGSIEVLAKGMPGVPDVLAGAIARSMEDVVCALFPWALRKVMDGVSRTIEERLKAR